MLDPKIINRIRKDVVSKFPEYRLVKPKVVMARIKPQTSIYEKLSMGMPKRHITIYKMRFKRKVRTEDNIQLHKILTVTFNARGAIIKITESK